MPLFVTTRIRGNMFSERAWNRANQAAMQDTGLYWQHHMLPRHFRRDAKTKYGHKPRTSGYLKRKRKLARLGRVKYGGEVDNVYTGFLEQSLQSAATVKAFPTRVTIDMQGPRYVTMRPYKSNQPDKAAEILTITAHEDEEIGKVFDANLQRHLDAEERRMKKG